MNFVKKLGLGTVQWGLCYGIANHNGRPEEHEVVRILDQARKTGISTIDTAHAYGEAEQVLGKYVQNQDSFRIITKTMPLKTVAITAKQIAAIAIAFSRSLENLGQKRIYGLLVHHADELLVKGGEDLWALLEDLRAKQQVEYIGVSVYDPDQLIRILERYKIDLVQLPFNIYDQRFAQTGMLSNLKAMGIEVHARSIFLQGLLLMHSMDMPTYFESIRQHQARLHSYLEKSNSSLLEATLSFGFQQDSIDRVIVGCESLTQLNELIKIAEKERSDFLDMKEFALSDGNITNPSKWIL